MSRDKVFRIFVAFVGLLLLALALTIISVMLDQSINNI